MSDDDKLLEQLGHMVSEDLSVYGVLRTLDFRSSGGVLRLRVEQSALGRLLDRRFVRRVLKLDVESRELDTRWALEDGGGQRLATVVHRFPYNTPFAEGAPSGRGFELLGPAATVLAHSDQRGRFFDASLRVSDGLGEERCLVSTQGFKTRLSVGSAKGEAQLDLVRGQAPGERWRVLWLKKDLSSSDRAYLGASFVLAMLWS